MPRAGHRRVRLGPRCPRADLVTPLAADPGQGIKTKGQNLDIVRRTRGRHDRRQLVRIAVEVGDDEPGQQQRVAATGRGEPLPGPRGRGPRGDRIGGAQGTIVFWSTVMAFSAALFAPIAIGVGRLSTARTMRFAVAAGVGAAVVQVAGLLRWPLLVPGYAAGATSTDPATAAAARDRSTPPTRCSGT